MSERERMLARIAKLMRFSQENATEGEVENALRMAQELMEAHAISQAELIHASGGSGGIRRNAVACDLGRGCATWEAILASAVATVVPGVGGYIKRWEFKHGDRWRRSAECVWYGPVDLVEIASGLYIELRIKIERMARAKWGGAFRGEGRSYAEGFAASLALKAERQRQASAAAEQIHAIVLQAGKENDAWLAANRDIRPGPARNLGGGQVHRNAFLEGRRDGMACDIQPGAPRPKLDPACLALPAGVA